MCSTSCANLTNWWCSYPRVSLFLTNPRPRPKLVCTRARQLLSFKRKIRSSSIPGSSLQQSVGCVEVAPVPGRLSPGHNLFSTPRFLYNWHKLCSNGVDTEAPLVIYCMEFEVFSMWLTSMTLVLAKNGWREADGSGRRWWLVVPKSKPWSWSFFHVAQSQSWLTWIGVMIEIWPLPNCLNVSPSISLLQSRNPLTFLIVQCVLHPSLCLPWFH